MSTFSVTSALSITAVLFVVPPAGVIPNQFERSVIPSSAESLTAANISDVLYPAIVPPVVEVLSVFSFSSSSSSPSAPWFGLFVYME